MLAFAGRRAADSCRQALFRPRKRHSCLSRLPACRRLRHRADRLGQSWPVRRSERAALGRAARAGLPRGRTQRSFCFDGDGPGRLRAALLHWLHGARQGRHTLLRLDADLHRRLRWTGLQRQPLLLLSLLGTGRLVFLQFGGILVHQPRSRRGRAQGAADDAHRWLRAAGGDSGRLPPHRERAVDRPGGRSRLHRRRLCVDAVGACGKVCSSAIAHLDSRSDGRAHAGERTAARGLLCEGRRLSGLPHAQLWRMACERRLCLGE